MFTDVSRSARCLCVWFANAMTMFYYERTVMILLALFQTDMNLDTKLLCYHKLFKIVVKKQ
jgi:hypothetical protein